MKKYNLESLEKFTSQVRRDIVRMVHAQNSGHPGGSLGCVEYFTAIYKVIMNHSTNFSMDGKNLWKDKLLQKGGNYKLWANAPSNFNLN